jgi:uncharacterized membrane protein YcaP (DUF421 family)
MVTSLWEVCGRTAVIYIVLFASLRLLGKREVSQFTPFDLVLLLTLSNAVQNAMVGSNVSLEAGVAAALTLMAVNYGLSFLLSRNRRIRRWFEGVPTLLVRHGKVEWRSLRQERLSLDDLMAALREHGVEHPKDAELAVLEVDGSVSVIPASILAPSFKRKKAGRTGVNRRS